MNKYEDTYLLLGINASCLIWCF